MNEQLDLFAVHVASSGNVTSHDYTSVVNKIISILSVFPNSADYISFSQNRGDMAIAFFSPPGSPEKCLWVKLGAKTNRLEVKHGYYFKIDFLMKHCQRVTPNSMRRVPYPFGSIDDLDNFSEIIRAVYQYREREASGRLFDCCHRYMECSDAMACTHPDQDYAMSCTYRRNLKQGHIFYGKNRSID